MSDTPDGHAADDQVLIELVREALLIADRLEHWLAAAHLDRALVSLGVEPPAFELPEAQ